jgi:hypothetical protein
MRLPHSSVLSTFPYADSDTGTLLFVAFVVDMMTFPAFRVQDANVDAVDDDAASTTSLGPGGIDARMGKVDVRLLILMLPGATTRA